MNTDLEFRRSTRCSEGGGCVGVAVTAEAVHVRDLKEAGGPVLTFTTAAWAAFLADVRAAEFDR